MDSSTVGDPSQVVESKGFESSKPRESGEQVDDAKEATDHSMVEPVRVVNTSVPEKVIFCIDAHFYTHLAQQVVSNIIYSYIEMKTAVAVKPVDFAISIMGEGVNKYVPVSCKKSINNVLIALAELKLDETQPYDFTGLFTDLAGIIDIPDPSFYNEELPPPHVYHFIVLFGRNLFIPTLESTNAYYFFMENPFVALDVLYLPRNDITRNKCKKIAEALKGLVDVNKGFFETCSLRSYQAKVINRFIGHPLIRFPQKSAVFDYKELIDNCYD